MQKSFCKILWGNGSLLPLGNKVLCNNYKEPYYKESDEEPLPNSTNANLYVILKGNKYLGYTIKTSMKLCTNTIILWDKWIFGKLNDSV